METLRSELLARDEEIARLEAELEPQGDGTPDSDSLQEPSAVTDSVEEEEEEEPEPIAQEPKRHSADGHEEETIDDYMSKLLIRLRGGQDSRETPPEKAPSRSHSQPRRVTNVRPPKPQPKAPTTPPEAPAASTPEAPAPALVEPVAQRAPTEMPPRATPPEKNVDLTAMRELANMSAHSALRQHARRQLCTTTRVRIAFTAAALILAASLLWMWQLRGASVIALYAAMAGFLLAATSGLQTLRLSFAKLGHFDWHHTQTPAPKPAQKPADDVKDKSGG